MIAYVVVAALLTVFVRIDVTLALVGHVGSALVAVLLLYAPVAYAWHRNEDLLIYGFRADPVGRGLLLGLGGPVLIFPLFALGYVLFYQQICDPSSSLSSLAMPGVCARFLGWEGMRAPSLDLSFAQLAMVQLVVVALPEELFFRGFLLHKLEQAFPPKRRILGGGIGVALILSSLMFAMIHLPKHGDPRALATFFPGLLFGWMRSATGSILAGTITHAASNLFVRVLSQMFVR